MPLIPPHRLSSSKLPSHGFSLLEIVLTVALLAVAVAIYIPNYSKTRSSVQATKLNTDVIRLNSCIAQYLADGGSLADATTATEILTKLKGKISDGDARRQVGSLSGRYVDVRLSAKVQSWEEAAETVPRAHWNNGTKRFEVVAGPGAPGIKEFSLDDTLAEVAYATQVRAKTPVLYNAANGWIWAGGENASLPAIEPVEVALADLGVNFDPDATPSSSASQPPPSPTPTAPVGPPGTPVLTTSGYDEVTGPNMFMADGKRHWYVTPGGDQYANDKWERPTSQTYAQYSQGYATVDGDYFGNLDIVKGSVGFDSNYLYFSTDYWSGYKHAADGTDTYEGLIYDYRIRFGTDVTGVGSYLINAQSPVSKVGTTWGTEGVFLSHDANMNYGLSGGDGYELQLASDGKLLSNSQQNVVYARVNPLDATEVQFALLYSALGLTRDDLPNLGFIMYEANKGLQDASKYAWNKQYSGSEAGSPNGGTGGLSEFGTQGLGNIYELDTWRGTAPKP